jgi:hypothetical protein
LKKKKKKIVVFFLPNIIKQVEDKTRWRWRISQLKKSDIKNASICRLKKRNSAEKAKMGTGGFFPDLFLADRFFVGCPIFAGWLTKR